MISLVIPVYIIDNHLKDLTKKTIKSLKGQYDELIIVDDASPIKVDWKADKVIRNKKNLGFTGTVNKGIMAATKDFICLSNNDIELLSGNIKDLESEGYGFPSFIGKSEPFWDGAFYVFPKKIGGIYDESYRHYFGDLDKFYNATLIGIEMFRKDNVVIKHYENQTYSKVNRNEAFEKDRKVFEKKWGIPFLEAYRIIGAYNDSSI